MFLHTKTVAILIFVIVMTAQASKIRHEKHRQEEKQRSSRETQSGGDRFKAIEVMRFPGKKFQFVQLKRFLSDDDKVNSLSFQFRAGGSKAKSCGTGEVVLYLDDGGATNYVKVYISRGNVVFNFKLMERRGAEEIYFEVSACNGLWHDIKLEKRNRRKLLVEVDRQQRIRTLPEGNKMFTQKSYTYIAGIPRDLDMMTLSNLDVFISGNMFYGSVREVFLNFEKVTESNVPRKSDDVKIGKLSEACAPSK